MHHTRTGCCVQVSGTTRMLASNGSAHFLSIKLRAREGPHNVSFYARMNDPNRLVKADQVGAGRVAAPAGCEGSLLTGVGVSGLGSMGLLVL